MLMAAFKLAGSAVDGIAYDVLKVLLLMTVTF